MQKLPEFPFPLTAEAFTEAFHRARAELHTNEAAAAAEEATQERRAVADETEDADYNHFTDRLIMGHELLLEVREPIEWLLALVRRLATGDPDDVAAIDRLTAAFHSRLACGGLGVRVADAMTGFGILIGALDRSVVVESATKAVADGVATILAVEGSALAAQIARLAESVPATVRRIYSQRPRGSRSRKAT
jgi:hypothetical protein